MRYFIYVQFGEQKDPFIHVVEVSEVEFFRYIDYISNRFIIRKENEFDSYFKCEVTHYYYGYESSTIASAGYVVLGNCSRPQ